MRASISIRTTFPPADAAPRLPTPARGRRGRHSGDDHHRRAAADDGPAQADRPPSHEQDPLVREVIWGIHIEGPFLNETPGYVGAHPPQAVRPADVDAMKRLLEAAGGLARLVTLAPERDPGSKVVRYLARQKVLVSAGHCDPSFDELRAAIDAGLSLFTHLGNGCPMMLPRHDNIIQRVLALRDRLTIMFIADGVHVPPLALGNYLRLAGIERRDRGDRRHFSGAAGAGSLLAGRSADRHRRGPGGPLAQQPAADGLDGDHAADGGSAA